MKFTTKRGQQKLFRNGYMYVHRRSLSWGSSMWECIYWRKWYQCNAKVKLSPLDEFSEEIHEHTHAPSQTECQVTKVKAGIKKTGWINRRNNTVNTRHWAAKYLWRSCSKPTIAKDNSQKCSQFSPRWKHATYISSQREHSGSTTGVSYHD